MGSIVRSRVIADDLYLLLRVLAPRRSHVLKGERGTRRVGQRDDQEASGGGAPGSGHAKALGA
jgi:hypothetical protein